ncbi:MAG: DUF2970 domain-containing protein [Burkholderiaceae bacterium]|nr:DUF2970 domain-containing protein [Burkholderiaceae bacterium]
MSPLRYVQMVLWSFFGIRRRAAASDVLAMVKPVALGGVALVLVLLFGLALWGFASLAVRSLGP